MLYNLSTLEKKTQETKKSLSRFFLFEVLNQQTNFTIRQITQVSTKGSFKISFISFINGKSCMCLGIKK